MKKIFSVFRRWELNFRTRKRLVARATRREGVLGRTGEPSVIFFAKRGNACERRRWQVQRAGVGAAAGDRQGGLSAADRAGCRKRTGKEEGGWLIFGRRQKISRSKANFAPTCESHMKKM